MVVEKCGSFYHIVEFRFGGVALVLGGFKGRLKSSDSLLIVGNKFFCSVVNSVCVFAKLQVFTGQSQVNNSIIWNYFYCLVMIMLMLFFNSELITLSESNR